jgi:hypothetical protein
VNFLGSVEECRQKYFGEAEPAYHYEIYHPHSFATKKKSEMGELIYLTKTHVLSSGDYSDDLKDAIRDNVFKLNTNAAVMFVMDPICDKTDAARHIGGLKRGMITIPKNLEELRAWAMVRDKRYQKRVRLLNKEPNLDNWSEFKSITKPTKLFQKQGPTLDHLFEKYKKV